VPVVSRLAAPRGRATWAVVIDASHPLLLGSASPRRLRILETLGIPAVAIPARADETPREGEPARAYLERVVRDKLGSVADRARSMATGGVLVADTLVLVDGEVLGKPRDAAEAGSMLRRLSGRAHEVWTRFALAGAAAPERALHEQTVRSGVEFRHLSGAEVEAYAASGEGLDKAGAYAVQGLGSFAVRAVHGSYTNVVGLPACELVEALVACGLLARFPPAPPGPMPGGRPA
jgi:septum formation protein